MAETQTAPMVATLTAPTTDLAADLDALELLSGDAQNFIDKVWASHIHVHDTRPDDLIGLLSLDDVDHLLTSTALRAPALRIAKDGSVLPSSSFTRSATLAGQPLTGLVDPRKVLELVDDGASVVLQGLHRYWPPLTELVRALELALGHPCQANAYLTPPNAQGFALHSDTHDVFVFQTHGSKHWEVHDESGAREVTLEPGVCMYLPAGTPHAARAQASPSLHVTLGINQVTWRMLLGDVVKGILDGDQYGGRLPAGYLADSTRLMKGIEARLRLLSEEVAAQNLQAVLAETTEKFLTTRASALRGSLTDRFNVSDLVDDTMLARRTTAVMTLQVEGDQLRLLLGDRALLLPSRLVEPLQFISEQTALRPVDLAPWLDVGSRAVLTRRLVREGLLRIESVTA